MCNFFRNICLIIGCTCAKLHIKRFIFLFQSWLRRGWGSNAHTGHRSYDARHRRWIRFRKHVNICTPPLNFTDLWYAVFLNLFNLSSFFYEGNYSFNLKHRRWNSYASSETLLVRVTKNDVWRQLVYIRSSLRSFRANCKTFITVCCCKNYQTSRTCSQLKKSL